MENWHELRTFLVWAYDGPLQHRFHHTDFRPDGVSAWLLRKGTVMLTFAGETERHGPGHWIFPRAQDGIQEFSEDAEILSVRFVAEWPDGLPLFDRSATVTASEEEGKSLTRLGERLARGTERSSRGNGALDQTPHTLESFLEGQRLFQGWLVAYSRLMRTRGMPPRVRNPMDERVWITLNRLKTRRLNEPLRESDLARSAGLSVTHLNRLFVANLGKTPAEFWEERRIALVRTSLLERERSIKSIAYDFGFSSLPHFSSWVRQRLGTSPREFRKQAAPQR